MVFFLAGVAATFGLSTLGVFILIWRAPLIEDRSGAKRAVKNGDRSAAIYRALRQAIIEQERGNAQRRAEALDLQPQRLGRRRQLTEPGQLEEPGIDHAQHPAERASQQYRDQP